MLCPLMPLGDERGSCCCLTSQNGRAARADSLTPRFRGSLSPPHESELQSVHRAPKVAILVSKSARAHLSTRLPINRASGGNQTRLRFHCVTAVLRSHTRQSQEVYRVDVSRSASRFSDYHRRRPRVIENDALSPRRTSTYVPIRRLADITQRCLVAGLEPASHRLRAFARHGRCLYPVELDKAARDDSHVRRSPYVCGCLMAFARDEISKCRATGFEPAKARPPCRPAASDCGTALVVRRARYTNLRTHDN